MIAHTNNLMAPDFSFRCILISVFSGLARQPFDDFPGEVRLLIRRLYAVARTCSDGLRAFCSGLGAYRFFPRNTRGGATECAEGAAARAGADERGQEQHGVGGLQRPAGPQRVSTYHPSAG